jgi:hypothetical protein
MTDMRVRTALLAVALAATLLAGCDKDEAAPPAPTTPPPTDNGVAALSAPEILTRAQAALKTALSYRITGTVTADGRKTEVNVLRGDQDVQGTVTVDGNPLEVLMIDGNLYLKGSDAFWREYVPREQQALVPLLTGKHVKVRADDPNFRQFTELFDAQKILASDDTLTKGELTTINGTPAITLADDAGEGTLAVATVGQPYPLRIASADGDPEITFTDFGTPVTVNIPPADQVLDLDAMMNRN